MTTPSSGLESRRLALEILCKRHPRFAGEVLDAKFSDSHLPLVDRRLISEMVYGVIKRSHTLERLIRFYSHRPPREAMVKNALMLGLYQLLFMDRVPSYAAVDTTVALLKAESNSRVARYGNALLRKIQKSARRVETCEEGPAILPVREGDSWEFSEPPFPDPRTEPWLYLACVHSYPVELVRRWYGQFGAKVCRELLASGNASPPVFLRVRPGGNRMEIMAKLREQGIVCEEQDGLLRIERSGEIARLPGFGEKSWTVTGYAAAKVVECLSPVPGQKVLDLCAAPGGKTIHLADLMEHTGEIVARDISPERLRVLEEVARREDMGCVRTEVGDGREIPDRHAGYFDMVLVDAPCSNTAVLAKRTEARWRFKTQALRDLKKLQSELLDSAHRAVKRGGTVMYSTCSLEPEENREVAEAFLKAHRDLHDVEKTQILPLSPHCDGATFFKFVKD